MAERHKTVCSKPDPPPETTMNDNGLQLPNFSQSNRNSSFGVIQRCGPTQLLSPKSVPSPPKGRTITAVALGGCSPTEEHAASAQAADALNTPTSGGVLKQVLDGSA